MDIHHDNNCNNVNNNEIFASTCRGLWTMNHDICNWHRTTIDERNLCIRNGDVSSYTLNWTPILSLIDDWTIKSAIEPIVLYKVGTSVSYHDVSHHDVSFMNLWDVSYHTNSTTTFVHKDDLTSTIATSLLFSSTLDRFIQSLMVPSFVSGPLFLNLMISEVGIQTSSISSLPVGHQSSLKIYGKDSTNEMIYLYNGLISCTGKDR